MKQARTLRFTCAADLLMNRFVTINKANGTVAYTTAGEKPDAITIGNEDNLEIEVQLLGNLYETFFFDSEGTIAKGGAVEVGTDGKGAPNTAGAVACYAYDSGVSGDIMVGYNTDGGGLLSAIGTPATGVTAVEEGSGNIHKTTLTVSTTLPAIAGGADLAVGKLLYTLPAGAVIVDSAYMSLAITQSEGNITADTPDGGLGTTIGSGAVAVLGGTAAFENILTGQTFADCDGTAKVKTVADQPLAIETGGDKTVYFNVADGWAASGDAAAALAGTVVLFWKNVA